MIESLYSVLEHYENKYIEFQNSNWGKKLGIDDFQESDETLVIELNELLQKVETDMTIFFRLLSHLEARLWKGLLKHFMIAKISQQRNGTIG